MSAASRAPVPGAGADPRSSVARAAILAAIARAAVPVAPLPDVPGRLAGPQPPPSEGGPAPTQLEIPLGPAPTAADEAVLVRRFITTLEEAGGTVVDLDGAAALTVDTPSEGPRRDVVSCVPGHAVSTLTIGPDAPRERLDRIGLAVVPARFGVAENGAVWVDERDLPHRAVPFIAERLAVVLPRREIVADLHAAYRRLRPPLPGYGVFIAGPSKTADIEQALVVGAQGPKSLVVLLI